MKLREEGLNFGALFALSLAVFIWSVLSPIWLPLVAWLVSFLLPVVWFVCKALLVIGSFLICGFALAAISLLLSGTIPSSKGF